MRTWQEEAAALVEPVFIVQGDLTRVELLCGLVVRGCPIPARRGYWGSAKGKPAAHVLKECTICPYYGVHTEAALGGTPV